MKNQMEQRKTLLKELVCVLILLTTVIDSKFTEKLSTRKKLFDIRHFAARRIVSYSDQKSVTGIKNVCNILRCGSVDNNDVESSDLDSNTESDLDSETDSDVSEVDEEEEEEEVLVSEDEEEESGESYDDEESETDVEEDNEYDDEDEPKVVIRSKTKKQNEETSFDQLTPPNPIQQMAVSIGVMYFSRKLDFKDMMVIKWAR